MRRPIFYYLARVLTGVVVLIALWGSRSILRDVVGGSQYTVTNTSPSPDGKFVATVYTAMGGGAAGWCSTRVTVNPVDEPFSIAREQTEGKYVVFTVSCGNEVKLKWDSERNLLVSYRNLNKSSGISTYKTSTDWGREVNLRYLEE